MAEGLARQLLGDAFEVASAGSAPTRLNPYSVKAMAEIGIDISRHRAKSIDEFDLAEFDLVVTLCGEEACPLLPPKVERLHWPVDDPASDCAASSTGDMQRRFRNAREEIRAQLKRLAATGCKHDQ